MVSLSETLLGHSNSSIIETRTRRNLERFLKNSYQQLEKSAVQAKASDLSSVHHTRIQFKKFRYSWDALAPVFPIPTETGHSIKSFQRLLGEIQDSSVLIRMIFEFIVVQRMTNPDFEFTQFLYSIKTKQESYLSLFLAKRKEFLKEFSPFLGMDHFKSDQQQATPIIPGTPATEKRLQAA